MIRLLVETLTAINIFLLGIVIGMNYRRRRDQLKRLKQYDKKRREQKNTKKTN